MTMERKWFSPTGVLDVILWLLFFAGILLILYAVCYQKKIERPKGATMLGILEIPDIEVSLPIYEGTKEGVLRNGVGHISESAGLGGGAGTHCLLAGHRGLPNQTLFTRLGELKVGDFFFVIQEERYTYRVCEIQVIRPEETDKLLCSKEKELVSLITCTPYGINTHRLVVTGERIE